MAYIERKGLRTTKPLFKLCIIIRRFWKDIVCFAVKCNRRRQWPECVGRVNRTFYYINTNEIPNHFTLIVFWCERRDLLCSHSNGDIFTCEDNRLFSHVRYQVFAWKLTWYFIGVYIINYNSDYYNNICYNCCFNKVAKRFGTLNLQVKVYQKCWKMNELYADRFQAPPMS